MLDCRSIYTNHFSLHWVLVGVLKKEEIGDVQALY